MLNLTQIQRGATEALRSRGAGVLTHIDPKVMSVLNGKPAAMAVAAGSVLVGVYAASQRDSVPWQSVAYAGFLGAAAALPTFAVGKAALNVAKRNAAELLKAGAIDQAAHGKLLLADRLRTGAPARRLLTASLGISMGAMMTNLITPDIANSSIAAYDEQRTSGRAATKQKPDAAAKQDAGK